MFMFEILWYMGSFGRLLTVNWLIRKTKLSNTRGHGCNDICTYAIDIRKYAIDIHNYAIDIGKYAIDIRKYAIDKYI